MKFEKNCCTYYAIAKLGGVEFKVAASSKKEARVELKKVLKKFRALAIMQFIQKIKNFFSKSKLAA